MGFGSSARIAARSCFRLLLHAANPPVLARLSPDREQSDAVGKTARRGEAMHDRSTSHRPKTIVRAAWLLEAGEGITFRCTYANTTANHITWGVDGGEMCMPMGMYALPAGWSRGVPPTMSVLMNSPAPAVLAMGNSGFLG
jgi:hypothetical protein